VYSASRDQVSDVWVQGEARVIDKQLANLDINQLLNKAAHWGKQIKA